MSSFGSSHFLGTTTEVIHALHILSVLHKWQAQQYASFKAAENSTANRHDEAILRDLYRAFHPNLPLPKPTTGICASQTKEFNFEVKAAGSAETYPEFVKKIRSAVAENRKKNEIALARLYLNQKELLDSGKKDSKEWAQNNIEIRGLHTKMTRRISGYNLEDIVPGLQWKLLPAGDWTGARRLTERTSISWFKETGILEEQFFWLLHNALTKLSALKHSLITFITQPSVMNHPFWGSLNGDKSFREFCAFMARSHLDHHLFHSPEEINALDIFGGKAPDLTDTVKCLPMAPPTADEKSVDNVSLNKWLYRDERLFELWMECEVSKIADPSNHGAIRDADIEIQKRISALEALAPDVEPAHPKTVRESDLELRLRQTEARELELQAKLAALELRLKQALNTGARLPAAARAGGGTSSMASRAVASVPFMAPDSPLNCSVDAQDANPGAGAAPPPFVLPGGASLPKTPENRPG